MSSSRDNQIVDVIIPIYNGYDETRLCLDSVLRHFDEQARLVLIDDNSPDCRIFNLVEETAKQVKNPVVCIKNETTIGFINSVNKGICLSEINDVIILTSDTVVTKNWINKLRAVAYKNGNTATVTPLSNNANICSVPEFCQYNTLPKGFSIDDFSELIERISMKVYPEIPTGVRFCMYIKRYAINILGLFDDIYEKGNNEENDFCMRALSQCLSNVLADDTFIYHKGEASINSEKPLLVERNRQILIQRYPFFSEFLKDYISNYPIQIWDNIKAHLKCLNICVDGRCLGDIFTGTQRYLIELLKYMMASSNDEFYLLIPNGRKQDIKNLLIGFDKLPVFVEESNLDDVSDRWEWDIFHRTCQVYDFFELDRVRPFAKRLLITYQDLILYKNPSYFLKFTEYVNYCNMSKVFLEQADGVIAISHYAKEDIASNFSIIAERVAVIYHGVNFPRFTGSSLQETGSSVLQSRILEPGYLFYLGTDFLHKNILVLVKLYERLVQKYNIHNQLVIAGSVTNVGNLKLVKSYVQSNRLIKDRVIFLGSISDEEVVRLYKNASVFLYMTNYEGFGLPPLEAFALSCPVVASSLTSVPEVVGYGAKYFHPGNFIGIEEEVMKILKDNSYRNYRIEQGHKRVQEFSWDITAKKTLEFYRKILALPRRESSQIQQLQLKLGLAQSQQQQTQVELDRSQSQQQQTQAELDRSQSQLQQTQAELDRSQSQIAQTKGELDRSQSQIAQNKGELDRSQERIKAMESSKFWKLRKAWFRLKRIIGLPEDE